MSNPNAPADQSHDLAARLRELDRQLPDGASTAGPAVDLAALSPPRAEAAAPEVAALLSGLGEEPAAAEESLRQVEALRVRWNEEWRREADSSVRRSELADLFEVVKGVSLDSSLVTKQLGTLLGAIRPFRWVGWVLLVMAVLDVAILLAGLEPMNPESEFKTFAGLADRAAVPLIGVAMVFWGGAFRRALWELRLLKGVSWLCLTAAVGYLGGIPLGVQNTLRLQELQARKGVQAEEKLQAQRAEANAALARIDTPRELAALASRLGETPEAVEDEGRMPQAREALGERVAVILEERGRAARGQAERANRAFWLQSVKVHLEALLAGALFFALWRMTGWARRLDAERTAMKGAAVQVAPAV